MIFQARKRSWWPAYKALNNFLRFGGLNGNGSGLTCSFQILRDSPVEPEQYLERLEQLRKNYRIDGLAFCEHRCFAPDLDFEALGRKYGAVILAGVEAETRWGHILFFSPDADWMRQMDFTPKFDALDLAAQFAGHAGIAIPAHPFRGLISLGEKAARLPDLHAIEVINGANLPEENLRARMLAQELGAAETGGSDAHYLDDLGKGLTEFSAMVGSLGQMISEIKARKVRALSLSDAKL